MLNAPALLPPAADTPVKLRRAAEPLTAESEQEASPGFEDISAERLFRQFSELVRVSEDPRGESEAQEEEELERRLTYDAFPAYRLEFEPKSSMRKLAQRSELPIVRARELFRPEPLQVALASQSGSECFTPADRARREHPELLLTPQKEHPGREQ